MMRFRKKFQVALAAAAFCACFVYSSAGGILDDFEFVGGEITEREIVYLHRASSPPRIDGGLSEGLWKEGFVGRLSVGGVREARNPTLLKAAYDDDFLYIGAKAYFGSRDLLKNDLPADHRGLNVWGDDCIDFKISPDGGVTDMQFLINANGAWGAQRAGDRHWNPSLDVATRITGQYYTVEAAIPLEDLELDALRERGVFLMAFGRTDRTSSPVELSTSFGESWGATRTAPLYVMDEPGTRDERALLAEFSPSSISRNVTDVKVYLDREGYPSFRKGGTGRISVLSSPGDRFNAAPVLVLEIYRGGRMISRSVVENLKMPSVDFGFASGKLEPGDYQLVAVVKDGAEELARGARDFRVYGAKSAAEEGRVSVSVPGVSTSRNSWPVTTGVPFPEGALYSAEHLKMVDSRGEEIPIQAKPAGWWSKGGSIRWLHVTFLPPVGPVEKEYEIIYGPGISMRRSDYEPLVRKGDDWVEVDTGVLKFRIPCNMSPGLSEVYVMQPDGGYAGYLPAAQNAGPVMLDAGGEEYYGFLDEGVEVKVEENGPLRAVIKVSGYHKNDAGDSLGRYILRYHAWRGQPFIEMHHTFIVTEEPSDQRYRNIRYTLPFNSKEYFFPGSGGGYGKVPAGGAYLIQLDDKRHKIYEAGVLKKEGGKGRGMVVAGGENDKELTVAVRDFWQNFPKELEVTGDGINIHFWPMHGEEPLRTGENLDKRNAYLQWFAHEGEILDFNIPEEVLELVKPDSPWNYANAKHTHAMGLAKTHEMLFHFDMSGGSPPSDNAGMVFLENPIAVVCPEWVCGAEVFGKMHHRDKEQFPETEKALDKTFDLIARYQRMDRDYGMFNYGNAHHNWIDDEMRWSLHRIWYNTHHGWTRWPWLMYARSGDRRIFDYARANAMMAADIAHVHYATDKYVRETPPGRKIVGGLCNYKGFSPWADGSGLSFNSAADALLWHYYVTGNMRSLETALAHGEALLAAPRPRARREGAGRITSAAALYFHTWDNDYLEFLDSHINFMLDTQGEDGSFPERPEGYWEDFAPFLQRYIELTSSRRAVDAMERWAGSTLNKRFLPSDPIHYKIGVLAGAYMLSGDEDYLRHAKYRVALFTDHVYLGDDTRYHGAFIANGNSNMFRSYFMQWAPYYLKAVSEHGEEPAALPPSRTRVSTSAREIIDGKPYYVFRVMFRRADEPVTLTPAVSRVEEYQLSLAPAGTGAAGFNPESKRSVVLPGEGPREYELVIVSEEPNMAVELPLLGENPPGAKEIYIHHPRNAVFHRLSLGIPFYFVIPAGAEEIKFRHRGTSFPARLDVIDAEGNIAARDTRLEKTGEIEVDMSDSSGETWSFVSYGYRSGWLEVDFNPRPEDYFFYYSLDPGRLFEPGKF